jgi:hypothetical protein
MDIPDLRTGQSLPAGLSLLAAEHEPYLLKQGIVDLALAAVQGCDWASMTQLRGGKLGTAASTDPVVDRADAAQYRLEEGPSLDAIWAQDTCHVHDTSSETRWPRWCRAAHRLGVGSLVTVRLAAPARRVGALNYYASKADAFGDEDVQAAHVFAAQAAVAMVRLGDLSDLQRGMQTRHIIEIAQGILMADDRQLTPSDAFRVLRDTAHSQHVGLRDFAEQIVEARRPAVPLPRITGGVGLGIASGYRWPQPPSARWPRAPPELTVLERHGEVVRDLVEL